MNKVGFKDVEIQVERSIRTIKVLETPTLLKRLFIKGEINAEEYAKKLTIYNDAINLKNKEVKLEDIRSTKGMKLRDYQQQIINYASNFKSFAIFDEPRLGKTPTVIKLLKEKNLLNEKIVVISPGKVIGNWIKRFKEWGEVEAVKYEGKKFESNIIVITYKRARESLKEILKWKPKVAILDEAHVLRNSRGIRARLKKHQVEIKRKTGLIPINQSILNIGKEAKHRYPLSGTPNVNSGEDIFATLQFLMPNTFSSFWEFASYYFIVKKNFMGANEIHGYQDEEKERELQELLNYCSTNNKQAEAMPWLKKPIMKRKNLTLTEFQKKLEYDLLEKGMIGDTFILNALEQHTHYSSIVLFPNLIKGIKTEDYGTKVNFLLKYLKKTNKNIAVFTTRTVLVNKLEKIIQKEMPYKKVYKITGKTKDEDSIKIQDEINIKSKKSDIIFIGNIKTCKEGISLEGLEKAIVLDQTWNPTEMKQLFHRLDATTEEAQEFFGEKTIILLHIPGTIDDIKKDVLKEKKSKTEIINDYKKFIEQKKKERNLNG